MNRFQTGFLYVLILLSNRLSRPGGGDHRDRQPWPGRRRPGVPGADYRLGGPGRPADRLSSGPGLGWSPSTPPNEGFPALPS